MNEVKESLLKMGWDENLIEHFIGKGFQGFETNSNNYLKNDYIEIRNITYKKDTTCNSNKYIYSSK